MTYDQKMKQYRFENKIKQTELAKRLGITQQVYSAYELGKQVPKLDFIRLFMKVTGVDLADEGVKTSGRIDPGLVKQVASQYNDLLKKYNALREEQEACNRRMKRIEKALKKANIQF